MHTDTDADTQKQHAKLKHQQQDNIHNVNVTTGKYSLQFCGQSELKISFMPNHMHHIRPRAYTSAPIHGLYAVIIMHYQHKYKYKIQNTNTCTTIYLFNLMALVNTVITHAVCMYAWHLSSGSACIEGCKLIKFMRQLLNLAVKLQHSVENSIGLTSLSLI